MKRQRDDAVEQEPEQHAAKRFKAAAVAQQLKLSDLSSDIAAKIALFASNPQLFQTCKQLQTSELLMKIVKQQLKLYLSVTNGKDKPQKMETDKDNDKDDKDDTDSKYVDGSLFPSSDLPDKPHLLLRWSTILSGAPKAVIRPALAADDRLFILLARHRLFPNRRKASAVLRNCTAATPGAIEWMLVQVERFKQEQRRAPTPSPRQISLDQLLQTEDCRQILADILRRTVKHGHYTTSVALLLNKFDFPVHDKMQAFQHVNNEAMLQVFIDNGHFMSCGAFRMYHFRPVLSNATLANNVPLLKRLVDLIRFAKDDKWDDDLRTEAGRIISEVAEKGCDQAIEFWIKTVNLAADKSTEMFNRISTSLEDAAAKLHVKTVQLLLPLLDKTTNVHRYHEAIAEILDECLGSKSADKIKRFDLVNVLLSVVDMINKTNDAFWSPLETALKNSHLDCAQVLIDKGARLSRRTLDEQAKRAIREGQASTIEFILSTLMDPRKNIHAIHDRLKWIPYAINYAPSEAVLVLVKLLLDKDKFFPFNMALYQHIVAEGLTCAVRVHRHDIWALLASHTYSFSHDIFQRCLSATLSAIEHDIDELLTDKAKPGEALALARLLVQVLDDSRSDLPRPPSRSAVMRLALACPELATELHERLLVQERRYNHLILWKAFRLDPTRGRPLVSTLLKHQPHAISPSHQALAEAYLGEKPLLKDHNNDHGGDRNNLFTYARSLDEGGICGLIDEAKARDLYQRAAEAGDADAQYNLGWMYDTGSVHVPANNTLALYWYEAAAKQGHTDAMFNLYVMLRWGEQVAKDHARCLQLLEELAYQRACADAQAALGCHYAQGDLEGFPKSPSKAFELLLSAAHQGMDRAQSRLAAMYVDGFDGLEPNGDEAVYWYEKAIDQGYLPASYKLGLLYKTGKPSAKIAKSCKKAFELFEAAASKGCHLCQYHLATMYDEGLYVGQDRAKALQLYESASATGHQSAATFNSAVMYFEGDGTVQDWNKAAALFTIAANRGEADAQYELGIMYLNGHGLVKDQQAAIQWLQKAASQKHKQAIEQLAKLD